MNKIINVTKHDEIKAYILDIVNSTELLPDAVTSINLPLDKVKDWYIDEIEAFNNYRKSISYVGQIFDTEIIWINVCPKGININDHNHPDYEFYSVHYLQFVEGHPHIRTSADGKVWSDPTASEGDILFFSGNTYHGVPVNTIDDLRITVCMSANGREKTDKISKLREDRNKKLIDSDWTQFADAPLSDIKKVEWTTYRQNLRDITNKYGSVSYINWPTKPE
jgi:hypothetical protein